MATRIILLSGFTGAIIITGWAIWRPLATREQTLRLPGTVEIQEVRLGSKVGGRVKTLSVREGDSVKRGDRLLEVDVPELVAQRSQLEAQLYSAEAELRKSKEGPRKEEKQAAHASAQAAAARYQKLKEGPRKEEIDSARGDVQAIAAELEQANLNLSRELKVAAKGASTAQEVEAAQATQGKLAGQIHAAQARLQLLEKGTRIEDLEEAEAELARYRANAQLLDAGSRAEDIEAAHAKVSELRAKLQELDINIAEAVVKAPANAVVEVVSVRPGDIVAPSQPVVRILEPEELWVKAYITEVDLGKIALNQTVEVSMDAYPNRRFAGRITFIANTSEFTPRNVQTINERRNQVFGIKVRVDDPAGYFKSGMAADVWVAVPRESEIRSTPR